MSRLPEGFAAALVREGLREESAGAIAAIAADRIRWPAGRGVPVVIGDNGQVSEGAQVAGVPVVIGLDGRPREGVTVSDFLRELRAAYPEAFTVSPAEAPAPAPTTLTAKAMAESAAQKSAQSKAVEDGPNPWAAGSVNLTRQAIITKNNPAKAEQLRAQAAQ